MYQVKLPTPDKFEFRAFKVTVLEPKTTWITSRPAFYFPAGIKIEVIDDVVAIHYAASGDSTSVQTNSWRRPTMVICQGPIDRESTAVWTVTLRFETKREIEINYESAPMLPPPLKKLVQLYHREMTDRTMSLADARQKAIDDSKRAQCAQIEYAEAEAARYGME